MGEILHQTEVWVVVGVGDDKIGVGVGKGVEVAVGRDVGVSVGSKKVVGVGVKFCVIWMVELKEFKA